MLNEPMTTAPTLVDPESVGFCATRLARIRRALDRDVEAGVIPGAVMLVVRHTESVIADAFGFRDISTREPMRIDTLFRLASMTKPLVSAAALMLVEEGRLQLIDPVSMHLPELQSRRVACGSTAVVSEPAAREMTIQDLLRHTSGLTYGEFGGSALHKEYARADLMNPYQTNADLVRKLAPLPLLHQPGTTFEYGLSTDVLGRVIEVVSGLCLDRFIDERISSPLGLASLTFTLTPLEVSRLAQPLDSDTDDAPPECPAEGSASRHWISGGGGLIGNALDYCRFARMLSNGGQLDGVRLLSPKTVQLMTSNALPPDVRFGEYTDVLGPLAPTAAMGQGFGLGLTIRMTAGRSPVYGSPGDYSWAGRWGSYFWVDPVEDLICVLLMHAPAQRVRYRALTRTLVYQALKIVTSPLHFEQGDGP
jgi:CubicO group peptidase (beta-lactamase class C family)